MATTPVAPRLRSTLLPLITLAALASGCSVECPEGTQAVGGACLSPDDVRDGGSGADAGPDAAVGDGEVLDGCNGLVCEGTCVDIQTDPENCGGCGEVCNAICDQGTCGGVIQVTAGQSHSCALLNDGTVRCWGLNEKGQLGDGSNMDRLRPTPVDGLSDVLEVAAGLEHTCAQLRTGLVACWGSNASLQVSDRLPTENSIQTPTVVPDVSGAIAIAAGGYHTCVLRGDGMTTCWGTNSNGQLGAIGPTAHRLTTSALEGAVTISAGLAHTCQVASNGTAECRGNDDYGQISEGEYANVEEIAAGGLHTCARYADGSANCWGDPAAGKLCNGMFHQQTSPDRPVLADLTNITRISAGTWATCFQRSDGRVYCCGDHGAAPDPSNEHEWSITEVPVDGVVELVSGGFHTCVRRETGDVLCWGKNDAGQLGDGTTFVRTTPMPVAW